MILFFHQTFIRKTSKLQEKNFFVVKYSIYYVYTAVYAAERFVLQQTFLSLKICGLKLRAGSNGACMVAELI